MLFGSVPRMPTPKAPKSSEVLHSRNMGVARAQRRALRYRRERGKERGISILTIENTFQPLTRHGWKMRRRFHRT
jgi:hypothetical protein